MNRSTFTGDDFVGSLLTDRPEPPSSATAPSLTANDGDVIPTHSSGTVGPVDKSQATSTSLIPVHPPAGPSSPSTHMTLSQTTAMPELPSSAMSASLTTNDGDVIPTDSSGTVGPVDKSQATSTSLTPVHPPAGPLSPSTHMTPSQIRPFPKSVDLHEKKRKRSMRSEVMTGSPFKNKLEEKEQAIAAKKLKAESRQNRMKMKSAEVQKTKKPRRAPKKNKKEKTRTCRDSRRKKKQTVEKSTEATAKKCGALKHSLTDVRCPACDEVYQDPPDEDWIQCASCQRWWHENCSAYDGGMFQCDLCA